MPVTYSVSKAIMMMEVGMLTPLKLEILQRGTRQTRMAVELGWDPAKLSRIVNDVVSPSRAERRIIANYLKASEAELFPSRSQRVREVSAEAGRRL